MSAHAVEPSDEPYRSEILQQMRRRHPGYFDTAESDMTRSAIFRALPEVITIVDFSKGLGHSDVVTVNADQSLDLSPARVSNWGPDPAVARDIENERGDATRAD